MCPGGRYSATLDGRPLRKEDGVHFDPRATPLVWEALLPDVLDAAEASVASTPALREDAGAVAERRAGDGNRTRVLSLGS